jgi:hypothetical protein
MNVLILYQFDIHGQLIKMLCDNLYKNGIKPDSFNVVTWRFSSHDKKRKKLFLGLLAMLMIIPKVRGLLIKIFEKRVLITLSRKYDIVDIHFFSTIYDEFIDEIVKRGTKVKITIWGSDFYRTDKTRREEQRKIYDKVDIIQTETQQIGNDFLAVYPEFANKVRLAHFGIIQFDVVNELLQSGSSEIFKKEMGLPADKIIIACGTNGSEGHQHLLIFEIIERLAPSIKEKIFLLIPMTYGGRKPYIELVKQKADTLGLPYKLLSSLLSMTEIGKLRIVSDLAVTIQKTDALSSAIQEHVYAGGILIAGDWLPYQILRENGVFYLTASLDSITETISTTIENYKSVKNKCVGNNVKTAAISSWNAVIMDWVAIYNELI